MTRFETIQLARELNAAIYVFGTAKPGSVKRMLARRRLRKAIKAAQDAGVGQAPGIEKPASKDNGLS